MAWPGPYRKSVMVIFLDANVLVDDPQLSNPIWARMQTAISAHRLRVVVPRLAVEEAEGAYKRNRHSVASSISRQGGTVPEVREEVRALAEAIRAGGDAYALAPQLEAVGVIIKPTPDVSHDVVSRRAIARLRPFNEHGNGYRDTLHWLSFLDELAEGPAHTYTFVTNDGAFFVGAKGEQKEEPHSALVAEVSHRLGLTGDEAPNFHLRRQINGLTVPGQYLGEPFSPDYGDDFALLVLQRELSLGGALGLPVSAFGWLSYDWMEPSSVANAQLLRATAQRLDGSTDIEVEFEVRGDVTFDMTTIVPNDDSDFPDLRSSQERKGVRLTGRALVPAAGVQHLTLADAEARPEDLFHTVVSRILNRESDPIRHLRTSTARNALFHQILQDVRGGTAGDFFLRYIQANTGLLAEAMEDVDSETRLKALSDAGVLNLDELGWDSFTGRATEQ
jgi:hypothetical protein